MLDLQVSHNLRLQLLQLDDAPELFTLIDLNREDLREWLPWLNTTQSVTDTRYFIQSTLDRFAQHKALVAAIRERGSIVGVIGFNEIDWQDRCGYIGYWLAASARGRGVMTESCRTLIDYAFTTLALDRLAIACASANTRSRAIPQRLGFKHEGVERNAEWLYDRYVDHEIYSLFAREWEG
jgi:ribosomal-protein-serine acetyltransferase